MKKLACVAGFGFLSYGARKAFYKTECAEQRTRNAISIVFPYEGSSVRGVVSFQQEDSKSDLKFIANLWGLNPNSFYAMAVHEFGDIGGEASNIGSNFVPTTEKGRSLAPLGLSLDLKSDERGNIYLASTSSSASLFGENSIVGRAVAVRTKSNEDTGDESPADSGSATAVLGIGVIGLAKDFKNVSAR